jgi:hypothetical protein
MSVQKVGFGYALLAAWLCLPVRTQARGRWWEKYAPTPGFLLTPQQTPWSSTAYDRYEALKATP